MKKLSFAIPFIYLGGGLLIYYIIPADFQVLTWAIWSSFAISSSDVVAVLR